jgi:hypothetical protein
MLSLALRLTGAGVLASSAALKLATPKGSSSALATFGLASARLRWVVWGAITFAEAALSAGVLAGVGAACYAGAALMLVLAGVLGLALARGRGGQRCGCFGPTSRVTPLAVVRNLALAAVLAVIPSLPRHHLSTDQWLGLGLAVSLLAVAGLAVAVLAMARQVGELRLALGPRSALEIEGEGPEIGERSPLIERFAPDPRARLALAVFSSEGCPMCASLEPSIRLLEGDPTASVLSFDEVRDADAWRALAVPGAPYAVALGLDGTVLAKGTFNSLPQLESVLGTAERRVREVAPA